MCWNKQFLCDLVKFILKFTIAKLYNCFKKHKSIVSTNISKCMMCISNIFFSISTIFNLLRLVPDPASLQIAHGTVNFKPYKKCQTAACIFAFGIFTENGEDNWNNCASTSSGLPLVAVSWEFNRTVIEWRRTRTYLNLADVVYLTSNYKHFRRRWVVEGLKRRTDHCVTATFTRLFSGESTRVTYSPYTVHCAAIFKLNNS